MIALTAKIHLIDSTNDKITSAYVHGGNSNISSGKIPIGVLPTPRRPFIFGASKFGEGYTFSDKLDYYVGGIASNKDGRFVDIDEISGVEQIFNYDVRVSGRDLSSITINFDTADRQFPTRIVVNNTTYNNDDPSFTLNNLPTSDFTVSFSDWNKPFYPAKIEAIYIRKTIDIDRRNILSMKATTFDRGNISTPSFGVRSNSSSIEFRDLDGEIADYAAMNALTKDLRVEMFIKDTLSKKEQKVATAYTEDWNYDFNNRTVSVSATDGLEDWQSINVEPLGMNFRNTKEMVVVYEHLREIANQKSRTKVASFDELDQKTKDALQSVKIVYPVIEQCSLWAAFSKLCVACMLHLYVRADGIAQPYYTYGD